MDAKFTALAACCLMVAFAKAAVIHKRTASVDDVPLFSDRHDKRATKGTVLPPLRPKHTIIIIIVPGKKGSLDVNNNGDVDGINSTVASPLAVDELAQSALPLDKLGKRSSAAANTAEDSALADSVVYYVAKRSDDDDNDATVVKRTADDELWNLPLADE